MVSVSIGVPVPGVDAGGGTDAGAAAGAVDFTAVAVVRFPATVGIDTSFPSTYNLPFTTAASAQGSVHGNLSLSLYKYRR